MYGEPTELSSPPPPPRLGPYRLLEEIGAGGMSRVYLAERDDEQFHRRVAIKLIDRGPDALEIVRRFRTERQILANFEHPHIARLFDGGETADRRPYFVLEHIDGVAIDLYCRHQRLSLHERLELFLAVASAVSYAHQNLIVHRDLKPTNILVTAEGVPKLLDFGIAKILKPTTELSAVAEETVVGHAPMTPQYASPEQIRGEAITTATDIYGLGLLLYELLTEKRPYNLRGRSLLEVERLVCETEVAPPSAVVQRASAIRSAELAGDLDAIVLKALAKRPTERYATVQQMAEDLRLFVDGRPLAVARPPTLGYQVGKLLRRHALAAALSAVLLTVLVGLLIALAVQGSRLAAERDQAQRARDRAEEVSAFLEESFSRTDPRRGGSQDMSAVEILASGTERLREELKDQPLTRADLLIVIGRVYRNLVMVDKAAPLLEEALRIREENLGEDSPEVAEALYEVAVLRRIQGDFTQSEELFNRSLALRRKLFPPDHPEVLRTMSDLAYLYKHLGRCRRAKAILDDVIARREAQGPSRDLTECYIQRANLTAEAGNLGEAAKYFLQIIEIFESSDPPASRDVVAMRFNLATTYTWAGRFEEAEKIMAENQEDMLEQFGEESYFVALSFLTIASLHQARGEFEEAERAVATAIDINRKEKDDVNPFNFDFVEVAARISLARGRDPETRSYLAQARKICSASFGEDHLCGGQIAFLDARLREEEGDPEGALEGYHEAIQLVSSYVEKNPEVPKAKEAQAEILYAQARVLLAQGAAEPGRRTLRAALEIVRPLLETESVVCRDLYVKALVGLGETEEARPYARQLWQAGWREPEFVELTRGLLGPEAD